MRRYQAVLWVMPILAAPFAWGQVAPPMAATAPHPVAATILAQQADVYAGPASSFYPTTRLKNGDRVIVLGDHKNAPGWLEIMPPPGSFSWIDARYVKVMPGVEKIGIVDAGDPKGTVAVHPGSAVVNKEPNVELLRVASGTQVFLLDRATMLGAVSYYPVAPVVGEVRFLPADAVRSGGTYAGGGSSWTAPTVATGWQSPTGSANFVLTSQQADQALLAGNIDRARLLYIDALRHTTDPAWQNYLNGQLAKLSAAPASPSAPGANGWNGSQPYQTASNPNGIRPVDATGTPPHAITPTTPPAPPGVPQKQWSPWGVLRSAPFTSREGQPMFVLEDRQTAKPLMYLTTSPGTSLRDYINQTVAVYGTLSPRVDDYVRVQILIAEQVATPPAGAR